MLRTVLILVVVVVALLLALAGRPHERAWYAERASVMASFEQNPERHCAPLLVTGGAFMGGTRLAVMVDAYEPGSRFRSGDETIERLTLDVADPVYDQPIAVEPGRVRLYYTRSGPPGPASRCAGAYADSGSGTIRLHRERGGDLRVELSLALVPEPLPVPGAPGPPPPLPAGPVRVRRLVVAGATHPLTP